MPALVIKSGPRAGEKIEISAERSIGRRGADITIDDSEMSRRHALLRPVATGLEVEDLGSLNGTFVNGSRIAVSTLVTPNDDLRLGRTTLAVEVEGFGRTVMSPDEEGTVVGSQPAGLAPEVNGTHEGAAPPPPPPPPAVAPPPAPAAAPSPQAAPAVSAPPQQAAPAAVAAPPPQAPPGAFQQAARQSSVSAVRSRHAASLLPLPTIYSLVVVAATAIGEVVYFAVR